MKQIATDLRAQAAGLRTQADKLDAMAASIDGGALSPDSFCGDARAREIVNAICADLGVSVALVLSRDRHDQVVVCRDICTHALWSLLGMRHEALAVALGRPGHSVCTYSLRRVRERRAVDKRFEALLTSAMSAAHAALAAVEEIAS